MGAKSRSRKQKSNPLGFMSFFKSLGKSKKMKSARSRGRRHTRRRRGG